MKKNILLLNNVLGDVINQTYSAAYQKNGVSGVASGFPDLDKNTKGWQKGELILLTGYERMGVGNLLISMALKMGIVNETPLAFFSLQKSCENLVQRMIMDISGLSLDKIMSGQLGEGEWDDLQKADDRLTDKPIYMYDAPNPGMEEIAEKAEQLVQNENVEILLIDNLRAIATNNPNEDGIARTAQALKILARELDVPILAAFEIKNELYALSGKYGKRPERLHFQNEEQIFEKADCVCFLHRPEFFHITEDEDGNSTFGTGELILQRHKEAEPDVIKILTKMEYGPSREN
jgi:replicative DNA helicase